MTTGLGRMPAVTAWLRKMLRGRRADEDAIDAEIARQRLAEIKDHPERLVCQCLEVLYTDLRGTAGGWQHRPCGGQLTWQQYTPPPRYQLPEALRRRSEG